MQQDMVAELGERAEAIRKGSVDPSEDNMLKITNEGRKLALDQRLMNEMLEDNENGKLEYVQIISIKYGKKIKSKN